MEEFEGEIKSRRTSEKSLAYKCRGFQIMGSSRFRASAPGCAMARSDARLTLTPVGRVIYDRVAGVRNLGECWRVLTSSMSPFPLNSISPQLAQSYS
ncbi:hypothetical protein GOBAR_DD03329 [Gossypium barbadense]|nr:hypothetical protein GOBAR_DD03329 [Gossypium barbadense]